MQCSLLGRRLGLPGDGAIVQMSKHDGWSGRSKERVERSDKCWRHWDCMCADPWIPRRVHGNHLERYTRPSLDIRGPDLNLKGRRNAVGVF
jgi:hypothetical protein